MASMPGQLSGPRTARAVLWIVETGFKHFYFGGFFLFFGGGDSDLHSVYTLKKISIVLL